MKKSSVIFGFILISITFIFLIGCEHEHVWENATCFSPKTCIKCEITEGEPAGHKWVNGNCEKPKYCTECGLIEGEVEEHEWISATCEKPKHCAKCDTTIGIPNLHSWIYSCNEPKYCSKCGLSEGEPAGHIWVRATCDKPKHCSRCKLTEGDPLGHKYLEATCTSPLICSVCKVHTGAPKGHNWSAGNSTTPRICLTCSIMEALPLPESGECFIGSSLYRTSEITIKSASNESCYIKLKGTSGKDVFSFFVRAGDTVSVPAPKGYFYVYFAHGEEWYGPEYLFGEDTTYSKDDDLLDFHNYTWEYTLYPVSDGNFTETPIDADEF